MTKNDTEGEEKLKVMSVSRRSQYISCTYEYSALLLQGQCTHSYGVEVGERYYFALCHFDLLSSQNE